VVLAHDPRPSVGRRAIGNRAGLQFAARLFGLNPDLLRRKADNVGDRNRCGAATHVASPQHFANI